MTVQQQEQEQQQSPQVEPVKMNIWDHFGELRKRLMFALAAMAVTTLASFIFASDIIRLLAVPVGGLEKLQAIAVTENISVFMRVSLLSGFILALPFILIELGLFIWPGLEKNEKLWVALGIPSMSILFVAGVLFAYFIMMPTAVDFLMNKVLEDVPTHPTVSVYVNFVTNLLFWIGVCFETPLVMFLLAKLGLVTAGALIRQWRIAIVVIAVIAAVVTPTPDPVNMSLLMLPLLLLYLLSIGLTWLARPRGE